MGIKVTDQEIETQLNQVKEQNGLADEQKYQAELAKAGITDAQVRDQVRFSILTNKIYEAVIKKVTVSDADIQAYYDKNPTKYQQPASREVRHILVKNEALAQKLHDQIQGGADFASSRRSTPRTRPRRPTAASSPRSRAARSRPSTSSSSPRRRAISPIRSRRSSAGTSSRCLGRVKPATTTSARPTSRTRSRRRFCRRSRTRP